MKKSVLSLLSIMAIAASCQVDTLNDTFINDELKRFEVSVETVEPQTRTSMTSDRAVVWSEDDRVAIFQGSSLADQYRVSPESVGETNGILNFIGNSSYVNGDFSAGTEVLCNVAYYPYSSGLSLYGASIDKGSVYKIKGVCLPETQIYSPLSFGNGTFPMVALTADLEDHNLKFKNVLGVIKLQLKGAQVVKSILIEGNLGEPLSGSAEVTVYETGSMPQIEMLSEATTSVTLDCGEGVQLDPDIATEFLISVPPTQFAEGFTVEITDADDMVYTVTAQVANTVQRSIILLMPPVSLDDIEPEQRPKDPVVSEPDLFGNDEADYLMFLMGIYNHIVSMDIEGTQFPDGGAAEFVRAFWTIQELPADAVKCAWGDEPVYDLNVYASGNLSRNIYTEAVYYRAYKAIADVNTFLRQTNPEWMDRRGCSDELKAKVREFGAEARFLRAYFYWVLLDVFGNVPLVIEDTPLSADYYPNQVSREELFSFIENELYSAAEMLPQANSSYPRVNVGSAFGLLARLYINAEVYTGRPRWEKARESCDRIEYLGYSLAPTHAELFRGDNGENASAKREMLFAASYDSQTMNYGGTTFILSASLSSGDSPYLLNGINSGWDGIRVPYEYVSNWFKDVRNPDYNTGEYTYTDKRAGYFYIKGRTESMQYGLQQFLNGWSFIKFNNIPHNDVSAEAENWSNIDFPLIRLGEIYLIRAEACYRLGMQQEALAALGELALRAGVEPPTEVNDEYLLAERSRELMWEGHRRTDLIRFHKWTTGYNWTYKGGVFSGKDLPSYCDIYPIPQRELELNMNLRQNPGY